MSHADTTHERCHHLRHERKSPAVCVRDDVPDLLCIAVEERPPAFLRLRIDRPAISGVTGDDVQVEVEDRLECDFAVTDEDIDSSQSKLERRRAPAILWPTDQT